MGIPEWCPDDANHDGIAHGSRDVDRALCDTRGYCERADVEGSV
jgi:hypothetical protein